MNKKVSFENKYEAQASVQDISYTGYKKIVLKTFQIGLDQLGMTLKKVGSLITTVYIS